MRTKSVKKCLMAACLLVNSLSTTPVLSDWNIDRSYKPQEFYDNNKFGDFPPTDLDQKLLGQLNIVNEPEKGKFRTDNTLNSSARNQPTPRAANRQASTPTPDCAKQNSRQPAYSNYNRGRNPYPQGNQRYNRNTNFNGPWNNSGSGFSGPWNNNGSSFSGPWNNNGSNFNMPWGNNGSGFNPMGNGGSWGW